MDASSFLRFAQAKPLELETFNGPEKGMSPWDAFFIWKISSNLSSDGFRASPLDFLSPPFGTRMLLILI
jgi:hypothetical protein